MFDTRAMHFAAACLAALSLELSAQAPSPSTDSLLRVVMARDSALAVRVNAVDSLRRALARPAPTAAVVSGPLNVRTLPELEQRIRFAADSIGRLIAGRGGSAIAVRVAAHTPVVTRDSSPAVLGYSHVITIAGDTAQRWSGAGRRHVDYRASAGELTAALARLVEEIAFEGVDSTLFAWLMVGRVPLAAPNAREASDVYTELVTTESAALRRCRSGDPASCLDALGVDSVGQGRLARWYAPSDFRSLLGRVAPDRSDSVAVAAWLRCRDAHDDDACQAAALAVSNDRVPLPLSATARFMFLREVLDAGGAGAYDRLLTVPGPLSARFAAAAREPIEVTVRRWMTRVERARPERMRVAPRVALASLGWAGVLLAFTFIRREPWS